MNDIYLDWGGDLFVNSTGDLALATGVTTTMQRVCRRLLTNPNDYLWSLDYGGGLGQFVGSPADTAKIEAAVMAQLALEPSIPLIPAPQIATRIIDASVGYVSTSITYTDPKLMQPIIINVPSS